MSDAQAVRVAVIGRTGKGDYGHGLDTVWKSVPAAKLVAVADESEVGRTAASARLGVPGYSDYREMLKKERPQVVSVCPRWPDCHREMVLAVAEYGASIFLEKPVARTPAEADDMIAACDKRHVKCAVAHQTRYSPRVKAVKELIAGGKLGDVLELRGHGKEDKRGGGEDLMVLGVHAFDLLRYLVGDPMWCFARVNVAGRPAGPADVAPGGEGLGPIQGDHIVATFGFTGLAVGTFVTHKARHGASARYWMEVRGTKGVVQIGYGALPTAFFSADPSWMSSTGKANWQPVTSGGLGLPELHTPAEVGNGNKWIAEDLLAAMTEDREPVCSLKDGRAAVEMALAVYESHKGGRAVTLPLKERGHPLG